MRFYYPTIIVSIGISLLTGAGCASLAKYFSVGDPDSGLENDPVAAAAMHMRRPASSPALDPADDTIWTRRYPPPADTISYGMPMEDVAAIWGRPTHVESAGSAEDGNQRWIWNEGLSSRYGLGTKRTVYFEDGRVAGWKR